MKRPPLPSRFSGPDESPGFLLWKLSNAWQRRQRAALKPFDLTHAQFVLLATTTWHGGDQELTQAQVSASSGIDPMTTSQLLRALEAAGLVERRVHSGDPRAKAIAVTAAGRERARQAVKAVEATDRAFFAPLEAELGELVRMFRALADEGAPAGVSRATRHRDR